MHSTAPSPSLHDLSRRARRADPDAARLLAERLIEGLNPKTCAEFIKRIPGITGYLTPDVFDCLADAYDVALAGHNIRDLPVAQPKEVV